MSGHVGVIISSFMYLNQPKKLTLKLKCFNIVQNDILCVFWVWSNITVVVKTTPLTL